MPRKPTGADWAKGLPERLVHAAAMALVDHTPGDDHTEPAARKATAAVLRALTRADCPKTIAAIDIRFWANDVERPLENLAPASPVQEGEPA